MSACCWKLMLHRPAEKSSIFPYRVPLVFHVDPGSEKSYLHAANTTASRIGPSRNRFWPYFEIHTGRKNIRKNIGVQICTAPPHPAVRGLSIASSHFINHIPFSWYRRMSMSDSHTQVTGPQWFFGIMDANMWCHLAKSNQGALSAGTEFFRLFLFRVMI